MSKVPTLSVCMIVKDEAANLPRALSSIGGLADELVVVDTGSTDDTVEVARRHGARVFHFPWCDDFSAARNESLKHATKDSILWLDADDEVPPESVDRIRSHLRKHRGAAAYFTIVSITGEAASFRSRQLRMFPNRRGILFEGRIHEQTYPSAKAAGVPFSDCDAEIIHHGYHTPGELMRKLRRNEKVLLAEMERDPSDIATLFYLARTVRGMHRYGEALEYADKALAVAEGNRALRGSIRHCAAIADKAFLLEDTGRKGEAFSLLDQSWVRFPSDRLIAFLLGERLFERKDYERAFQVLLPLKDVRFDGELLPLNSSGMTEKVCRCLGVSALVRGDLETAKDCFREGISMNPSEPSFSHYLCLAEEKGGSLERAVHVCNEAVLRHPGDGSVRKRLFFLLLKSQRLEEALDVFDALNGDRDALDVACGMFFLSSSVLNPEAMQRFYRRIQERLHVPVQAFPLGMDAVRRTLAAARDGRASEFFEYAISKLLAQNP